MDTSQKLRKIVNENGIKFEEESAIDLSNQVSLTETTRLEQQEWSHVHIGGRSITFDGNTYSLHSDLKERMSMPKVYFGQSFDTKVELNYDDFTLPWWVKEWTI